MRPSGLTKPCARCDELMPFDPQAQNQLCNGCNRLLALGGLPIQDSVPQQQPTYTDSSHYSSQTPMTPTNYQGFSYTTSPQTPMTPANYQGFTYSDEPQPTTTPPSYSYMGYSGPPQDMMTPPNLKRKHISDQEYGAEADFPNKRLIGNAYAPITPSALRQNVLPETIDPRETVKTAGESEEEEEEADEGEEFVDAQEDQVWEAQPVGSVEHGVAGYDADKDAEDDIEEIEEVAAEKARNQVPTANEKAEEEIEEQPAEGVDGDEDDLFQQTFGKSAPKNDDSDEDADDDDENNDKPRPAQAPTAPAADFDHKLFIATLSSNKTPNTTTTAPAPATTKPKSTPKPPTSGLLPPTLPTHLAHNLRKQHSFHHTALNFLPRLPLAAHRYWIGVLKLGVPPRATQSEKNFIWMKGNRKTTVETVWRAFCLACAVESAEGVVLLVGFERPGSRTRAEVRSRVFLFPPLLLMVFVREVCRCDC